MLVFVPSLNLNCLEISLHSDHCPRKENIINSDHRFINCCLNVNIAELVKGYQNNKAYRVKLKPRRQCVLFNSLGQPKN